MDSDFNDYTKMLEDAKRASDAVSSKFTNGVGAFGEDVSGAFGSYTASTGGYTGATSTVPGGVEGVAWGCGQCPDFVLGVLVDDCRDTLRRVRQLKSIVYIINRLVTDVAGQLVSDLKQLAAMIPVPPFLDISAIVRMLSCPLTPQGIIIQQWSDLMAYVERAAAGVTTWPAHTTAAIAASGTYMFTTGSLLATLDPKALINRIVQMISAFVRQLRLLVETFLEKMAGAAYVQLIYRYIREFWQYACSADTLVLRLGVTSASVALVRATCPELFERDDLPFKAYLATMVEFKFDGVFPSGLSEAAVDIFGAFMEIEARIALWSTTSLILVV